MPPNVAVASFIFGAILILLALLGGGFKLFGAEIESNIGMQTRVFAGIIGAIFVYLALFKPLDTPAQTVATTQPTNAVALVTATNATAVSPSDTPMFQIPTAAPTAIPQPTAPPLPTNTPAPKVGDILYQADWSKGMNGWSAPPSWKTVNGMFVSDSTPESVWAIAPFEPRKSDINDYAVEAEVQFVRPIPGCKSNFGIALREDNATGYAAVVEVTNCFEKNNAVSIYCSSVQGTLQNKLFSAGTDWHRYRAEVKGNVIRLLIDDAVYLDTTDNHFLTGGRVGLATGNLEVNVRSFKVIKL